MHNNLNNGLLFQWFLVMVVSVMKVVASSSSNDGSGDIGDGNGNGNGNGVVTIAGRRREREEEEEKALVHPHPSLDRDRDRGESFFLQQQHQQQRAYRYHNHHHHGSSSSGRNTYPDPSQSQSQSPHNHHSHYHQRQQQQQQQQHTLHDTLLLASIDGKFHAVSRSTGHTLWSMAASLDTTSVSAPSELGALVRSGSGGGSPRQRQGREYDDDSNSNGKERYIIEPQSGSIYILSSPSSPLSKFPLTMQELVDVSPFTASVPLTPSPRSGDDGGENNGQEELEETRVFVGRKETSLILLELETGRVKATLNSECPFFGWQGEGEGEGEGNGEGEDDYEDDEVGDDYQEARRRRRSGRTGKNRDRDQISAPTEVYIGRTDYHISIYSKLPSSSSSNKRKSLVFTTTTPPAPVPVLPSSSSKNHHHHAAAPHLIQNLSFSTYGPNNQHTHLQALYRHTQDGRYVQGLPNGEVIAFRVDDGWGEGEEEEDKGREGRKGSEPLWGHRFDAPIVVVFDVLLPSNSSSLNNNKSPFVLLQPRPGIQDLFPSLGVPPRRPPGETTETDSDSPLGQTGGKEEEDSAPKRGAVPQAQRHGHPNMGSAYVGLLEETESLYAMSPERFPLVLFGGSVYAGDDEGGERLGKKKKVVFPAKGKGNENGETETIHDKCLDDPDDPRCLVGIRPLVEEVVDDYGYGYGSRGLGPGPGVGYLPPSRYGYGHPYVGRPRGLLDGPSGVELPPPLSAPGEGVGKNASARRSWFPSWAGSEAGVLGNGSGSGEIGGRGNDVRRGGGGLLQGLVLVLVLGVVWVLRRKVRERERIGEEEVTALASPVDVDDTLPVVVDEGEESDGEAEEAVVTAASKKKVRRGKRGKKKRGPVIQEEVKPTASLILTNSPPLPVQTSLVVSDTILGFGSHGTVVLQGSLQGRSVAVKRLLRDFVTLAQREVSILQESDDHPNVIRYFYQETHENFLYIALELCPASLADLIETPQKWIDINASFDPKRALGQVTSGLSHLHGLKIVHRDIKPQNILVSAAAASSSSSSSSSCGYRMLISDFGLCKKLDIDQTSFLPTAHGAHAAGTVGWRAPEILRGQVKLDDQLVGEDGVSSSSSSSSSSSVATVILGDSSNGNTGPSSTTTTKSLTRLTKSVDIFSLGCLFYYTLTSGGHPYGDRFEREVNIMKDAKDVGGVERFGEEGTEVKRLILGMVEFEARKRPDTQTILRHPYFWDSHKRLTFLQDASDRFEIMCRDPTQKDPHLLTLERGATEVLGQDWHSRLDKVFVENLGKYRKYDGRSIQDLLRALRNKKHHYQDLPDHVKIHLGPMPDGFLAYFTKRFPNLFLHVYGVVEETGLYKEAMFRGYFFT